MEEGLDSAVGVKSVGLELFVSFKLSDEGASFFANLNGMEKVESKEVGVFRFYSIITVINIHRGCQGVIF